jgi:3-oxoadipate enol-lactonase
MTDNGQNTDHGAINAVRTGPRGGTPVVLVHPVGLDLGYWGMQIEALRQTHDVVAYDLPGHGRSAGRPGDLTLDHEADVLAGVIRSTGASAAHIIGLSVGGMIAQTLAIAEPALAASLTLIGTAATLSEPTREAMRSRAKAVRTGGMQAVLQPSIERWFTPEFVMQRPDMIDRITKTLLADDATVHAAMWDMISALDLAPKLGTIACPTLVLVGELDPSTPPAAARFLHENIAGATMQIIPEASHMVPFEKPEAVNAPLLRFLSAQA